MTVWTIMIMERKILRNGKPRVRSRKNPIQNIKLGPTLPAFISPNVLAYLVEHYHIAPITTPEADLKEILGA